MSSQLAPHGLEHRLDTTPGSYACAAERSHGLETVAGEWPPRKPSRRSNDAALHSTTHSPSMALLKQALDQIGHGVLLVSDQAQVRYANRAAARALSATTCVALDQARLHCRDPREHTALLKALAACRCGRRSLLSMGAGRTDLFLLAVVPVSVSAQGDRDDVVALVTLSKRQGCDALALQFFAQEHQLTHAEGRVLQRLCEGLRVAEIAAQGGVALCTVRSQIRSICQKTQANSIRALVGLVNMLPPMVCAFEGPKSELLSA